MVATGEQSGRLGELMIQCVQHIDQQLDLIIDTLGKLVEPILLIFIGVLVCFLALSLYLPLFQSYSVSDLQFIQDILNISSPIIQSYMV